MRAKGRHPSDTWVKQLGAVKGPFFGLKESRKSIHAGVKISKLQVRDASHRPA